MERYYSTFLLEGPAGGRWRWQGRRTLRNSDLVRFYSKSAADTPIKVGICCTFGYILQQVYINAVKMSVDRPFSESGCDT